MSNEKNVFPNNFRAEILRMNNLHVILGKFHVEIRKLSDLLNDRQLGNASWHDSLSERLKKLRVLTNQFLGSQVPQNWQKLFNDGWEITRTSCACGGQWAWLKPCPSGAKEIHGCVCHNTPEY